MKNKITVGCLSPFNLDAIKKIKKKINFINLKNKKNFKDFKDIHFLVLDTRQVSKNFLDKFINLKCIMRFGVGIDNIDKEYLLKKKINLSVTKNSVIMPVVEHTIGFIFASLKKYNQFHQIVNNNQFSSYHKYPPIVNLESKSVLIIGMGKIGKKVAKILNFFNCKISFYDPFVKKYSNYKKIKKLDKNLKKFDIISVHAALNKSTKNLINNKNLQYLKNNSIIVNTSRGGIINEKSVAQKIKNKSIFYCTDVFEQEPPPKSFSLKNSNNTILTPHVSTSSKETRSLMSNEVIKNIEDYINGKKNKNLVF